MKKFIDKLKGVASAAPEDAGGAPEDDSRFFSTMFQDRDDQQAHASWRERAVQIGARDYDRAQGAEKFARLWGVDRYVASLSPADLERMSQYLSFVEVPANQEIIGQDEQGDYMLIVLEGSIAVDRIQPWGARARLAEARPGDMLGEMSLLDAGARFSACTTLTPCVLAVVDAQGLDEMIMQEPRLGLALLASLARRLSLRLRQVSARLSALLSRG
ncbi:cyclic nucleotide-binding domain-containing protein [Caldimonas caldifontis]|uniref:Crp/Fnr family transcriptional regulator n=1 Tax=Caldimonas caldifontis TaxID=1452508 RepID=A0A2S5SVI1_9BURK|nr:cyclic nucleotide-binding domain-containing protein [Caldimonas caldifontis]PPE66760.1 Crp/Fnr family transcriptional regulator [Caldimonas caldifontis]